MLWRLFCQFFGLSCASTVSINNRYRYQILDVDMPISKNTLFLTYSCVSSYQQLQVVYHQQIEFDTGDTYMNNKNSNKRERKENGFVSCMSVDRHVWREDV